MRIGFDATALGQPGRYSGIGKYVLNLLNNLARAEGANAYLAYGPAKSVRPEDLHPAVEWKRLPNPPLGKLTALAVSVFNLPRIAVRDSLDLFHAPTVHPRPSLLAVPRRMPCPLAVTIHDLIPLTLYDSGPDRLPFHWRSYYRWNLRGAVSADLLISVSEASRRELRTALGSVGDRVRVIHNGVEPPPQAYTNGQHTHPYVLFAGSFEPRKNLARFIRAYAAAVARGLPYDLVVVAHPDSGDKSAVESEIDRAGLRRRIRFIPAVSENDLWDLYRSASIVAFPSLAEGFGLPPLEAMAVGTPVIASNLPALREVLGDAAMFVDPYSETDMSAAMLALAAAPPRRELLSQAGLRRARLFSWRDCAEQTLTAYEEVWGRKHRDRQAYQRAASEAA